MTETETASKLVAVLGASGRLGRALLPHLVDPTDRTTVVVGVSRTKPDTRVPGMHWQLFDLSDEKYVDLATKALSGMSTVCGEVVIVDALLDRSSVSAMRRSIATTVPFAKLLRARAEAYGRSVSVVLASTLPCSHLGCTRRHMA